ncbi:MAG: restriction endonuclease subunit S [Patescibacteria group bacterium]
MTSWQTKKLGNVCRLIKGKKPQTFVSRGGRPYLTARVVRGTEEPKFAADNSSPSISVKSDDIVIIMDGSNSGEMFTGLTGVLASTMGIVSCPKDLVDSRFLLQFLSSYREDFTKSRTGSAIPHLNKEEFDNLEIPLPKLSEQRRLVALLDETFAAISKAKENTEKNLKNSRELFESHSRSVFESPKYEKKNLGEVCERVEYGSSAKSKKEGKVPVLRMGNIQDGKFVWDSLVYSDNEEEIEKYTLKHDDVLFNRTNSPELVGKTAIYKGERPAIFAGYLIRIHRKIDLLDADYLNYFLNSYLAKEYGKTVLIGSVNQANINGKKLLSYQIPVPEIAEQRVIVERLNALSEQTKKLEEIYRKKLAALEELKKSVLRKAFAGEL